MDFLSASRKRSIALAIAALGGFGFLIVPAAASGPLQSPDASVHACAPTAPTPTCMTIDDPTGLSNGVLSDATLTGVSTFTDEETPDMAVTGLELADPFETAYTTQPKTMLPVFQQLEGQDPPPSGSNSPGPVWYPSGDPRHIEAWCKTPTAGYEIPLRTGYWPGGTSSEGYGHVKILSKHNWQNMRLVCDVIYADWHYRHFDTRNNRYIYVASMCNYHEGWCENLRVVTNETQFPFNDNEMFGVVTAYCPDQPTPRCPNEINGPYVRG